MQNQLRKVKRYLDLLSEHRWKEIRKIENIAVCPTDYKADNIPPEKDRFSPLPDDGVWGSGKDTHAWMHFTVSDVRENEYLHVSTEFSGWDATNPQFLVYVNGEMRQGLDTNHQEIRLEAGQTADVYLYAYLSAYLEAAHLFAERRILDVDVDKLYYDILYARQMLDFLNPESGEYATVLYHLNQAVTMLDLFDLSSEAFVESVRRASEYLHTEFYGKYCSEQKTSTVCIGHTHIDCAWRWTLRQTKEKAQRSFSTVLELMNLYPEYKFMSSQALLYKDVKEEAPELYEKIKARIKEGRWECEGAMWVEADCNLPSGESLVRQVLYGKNFFQKEFGVNQHILWLPDVFGYSAALPQILRKSGVDWFVTSKISWNDVNRMPYDTFRWKGIDGTEINSYFLTAQDDDGKESVRYTTYVAHTNAQMIAGTYKRYSQKQLSDEALLTFGFGDGGGGPTREHLELIRRGTHGVPGCPNTKIDFAGDFLGRLEKKIENNPLLPKWQGELYLEFHRGTYTTMARNKRNNRKSEFLYQNAELYGSIASALLGTAFPADELHKGWEMILTNQFHDIIPGSSIQEVYEQSDIDYAEIHRIGTSAVSAAQNAVASAIDKKEGYVVFNPTSFGGNVETRLDGVTVFAEGIAPTGYTACKTFVRTNHVKIDGKTVETDRFRVLFDDAWQIISVFDRQEEREILKKGAIGNELRIYADYPDTYDAWEWQAYSRDTYRTLTAFSSAEVVEDGVRRGIRIVRPHMSSTVTQTIWFYDNLPKIEFETVADWHDHHQMLKAAFPVDINTDKATYEIQFGSVERPTHFNTSWDAAKFEVCAQKYADISEGDYGVSIINDCKYGHDIHDGVMQLSLLRSPTSLNPISDQGEIPFTYALCPHTGTLKESDTVALAFALNNPAVTLPATGDATRIPLSYSAVRTNRKNVICDTVKPAEDGKGTILRFYESKNARTQTEFTFDAPVKEVWLCDLMENKIAQIPVENNSFSYTVGGFEILTVKVF